MKHFTLRRFSDRVTRPSRPWSAGTRRHRAPSWSQRLAMLAALLASQLLLPGWGRPWQAQAPGSLSYQPARHDTLLSYLLAGQRPASALGATQPAGPH